MFSYLYNKYKSYYSSNLKLAIPVVISQLGHTLVHTADSIIVGQFAGTISLAAVALVNSIFMIIMVMGIGISYGLTPLIAQENGRNNFKDCGTLLINSLYLNITVGILLYISMYFGTIYFIDHLHQSSLVVAQAKPYIKLLSLSIIPLMIFLTFKQFAEGLGFTKQAMFITIAGNIFNILLGITLVRGLFGLSPLGIRGVGYSTLIDRCLMSVAMACFIFYSAQFKKYIHNVNTKINKAFVKRIFTLGAPTALQYTFEVSAFSGAAIIIGTFGAVEQAAHQVALNLASTTYMMAGGIGAAATVKVGNNFGSKNFMDLRLSAISSYHIVIVFMSITACLFILLNNLLPQLYSPDILVVNIASQLLIIASIFQLFDGAQVVGLGVLRGMGDVNIPTVITFLAYWVLGLPCGYFLGVILGFGVYGVWIGLTLALLVASILLFLRFNKITKEMSTAF